MLFFLYSFIFSCFSKARKAVKGLPNRECSYTELTLIEVSDAFFCPQITQMDTNSFSDRFFSDCTDCWSLGGSCHAGCFAHQSSSLATTIIRAIRENL